MGQRSIFKSPNREFCVTLAAVLILFPRRVVVQCKHCPTISGPDLLQISLLLNIQTYN